MNEALDRKLAEFYLELGAWVRAGCPEHQVFEPWMGFCACIEDWSAGTGDRPDWKLEAAVEGHIEDYLEARYPGIYERMHSVHAYPLNVDPEGAAHQEDAETQYNAEMAAETTWQNWRRLAFLANRMQWAALLQIGDQIDGLEGPALDQFRQAHAQALEKARYARSISEYTSTVWKWADER